MLLQRLPASRTETVTVNACVLTPLLPDRFAYKYGIVSMQAGV